jgi:hypothetical protein
VKAASSHRPPVCSHEAARGAALKWPPRGA